MVREENFLSLAGNLVVALFGIAGFALLARSLSVEKFGEWVLFITAGSLVEMLRFGLTNTGLIRYLSGANESSRIHLIGSNALIGLLATLLVSVILITIRFTFPDSIEQSGYALFFSWYPLLALLNFPWNNALVVLQADRQYGKILTLKLINSGSFFIILLINYGFLNMSVLQIVGTYLIINLITSIYSMLLGWAGLKYISRASAEFNSALLHFGKYSTFTLIGTNLLRSADMLIISLSPLGSAAVSLYSIPLKLTELQQIPLRSFATTAFPKMSKASVAGKIDEVRTLFYTYAGALTFLFFIMSIFTFLFADVFVLLIAGKQYLQTDAATGFNAVTILRIFSVYGLLLPIDRMTGMGLDSINKPAVNALKVFIMLLANIGGDLLAIFVFKSLAMVAVSSILFTLIGIWIGMRFLNKELALQYNEIFKHGISFYRSMYNKLINKLQPELIKL